MLASGRVGAPGSACPVGGRAGEQCCCCWCDLQAQVRPDACYIARPADSDNAERNMPFAAVFEPLTGTAVEALLCERTAQTCISRGRKPGCMPLLELEYAKYCFTIGPWLHRTASWRRIEIRGQRSTAVLASLLDLNIDAPGQHGVHFSQLHCHSEACSAEASA